MPERSNKVLIASSIFAGFGVAHVIDDFLFGVPAEFNLTDETAQWLGLAFFAALAGLIGLAGRGSRQSYYGLALIGLLLPWRIRSRTCRWSSRLGSSERVSHLSSSPSD